MSFYYSGYRGFDAERTAVQAFAWSAPMRDLAKLIGISDVALKKQLNKLGIVTPPQGHWNRVAAGRPVPDPPPIPRRPGQTGRVRLDERFKDHIAAASPWPTTGPFASAAIPEDLDELRAIERKAIGKVAVPRDLSRPAAGLVQLLRREEDLRRKAAEGAWAWSAPHFDGPLEQRKLRLLSALFGALAGRGQRGDAFEQGGELHVRCGIGDMQLGLEFAVVGQARAGRRTGHAQTKGAPGPARLRLALTRWSRDEPPVGWEDDEAGRLESRVGEIVAELIVLGEASFRQSLIEAEKERARQRERAAEAERARIAALEVQRIEDLKVSGALLAQASELRALVARVKNAAGAGGLQLAEGALARWERWALAQADQLDPVLSGQVLSHLVVPDLDGAGASGIEPDFT